MTHTERQYSQFMNKNYKHSIQKGIEEAGDPYDKNVIVMFCNDGNTHWYLTILDRIRMCIVHFDSGVIPPNGLQTRCSFLINFVNDFRDHVKREYSLNWPEIKKFTDADFQFKDGNSVKQKNSFDCGMYCMVNAESYITNCNHEIYTENVMPLARMIAIQSLLTIASTDYFPFKIIDDI